MFALIGILSGLAFVIADLPYIKDTISGKTKPHRTSWFLYFVLNAVSVANQAASGATNSLWFPIAGALTTLIIFILSIRRGMGGYEKLDIICLAGALIGIGLWIIFDSPVLSIIANMAVTLLAVIPTIKKAYLHPHTETSITYLISAISALLAAISVGELDWVLLLLPIYSLCIQLIVYSILTKRRQSILTPASPLHR